MEAWEVLGIEKDKAMEIRKHTKILLEKSKNNPEWLIDAVREIDICYTSKEEMGFALWELGYNTGKIIGKLIGLLKFEIKNTEEG